MYLKINKSEHVWGVWPGFSWFWIGLLSVFFSPGRDLLVHSDRFLRHQLRPHHHHPLHVPRHILLLRWGNSWNSTIWGEQRSLNISSPLEYGPLRRKLENVTHDATYVCLWWCVFLLTGVNQFCQDIIDMICTCPPWCTKVLWYFKACWVFCTPLLLLVGVLTKRSLVVIHGSAMVPCPMCFTLWFQFW